MPAPKTQKTAESVHDFINAVEDPDRRHDAHEIMKLMDAVTKDRSRMWGTSIIGSGTYSRSYADGSTQEWMLLAFAPRKDRLTLYIAPGFAEHDALMEKLGKYRAGKGCIHIKRLKDIDLPTLEALMQKSMAHLRARYG